jgi:hypothetical protein
MRLSSNNFRDWEHKAVTFLGMSGVGKTRLARILRKSQWFHYSVDYRIGTRYLDEPILDNIKAKVMQIQYLRELMRSDSIHIANNITVDNLQPLSSFLGKIGNPELGGLGLREFKLRQRLHRDAEIAALTDVPVFINKAQQIYGYRHFVNDAGGSICELNEEKVISTLAEHTLIIYIQSTKKDEQELIKRAEESPKPLYYREEFLDEQLASYLEEYSLGYAAQVDPDDFCRWVFPRLFYARIPRYEAITREYGYTVSTEDVAALSSESEFLGLIERTLEQQN